jgi:hypothetical protein
MDIGGQDVWVEGNFGADAVHKVLQALSVHWPQAVVEHADGNDLGTIQSASSAPYSLPCELFVYREQDAREAWDDVGRSDHNSALMIYVFVQPTCTTLVSEGSTVELARKLLDVLCAE